MLPTRSRPLSYTVSGRAAPSPVTTTQPYHVLGQLDNVLPGGLSSLSAAQLDDVLSGAEGALSPLSAPPIGKKWGMLIAIQGFSSRDSPNPMMVPPDEPQVKTEEYSSLPGVHEDAEKLYDVLTTVHGYPPENIIRLMDDGKEGSIVPTHNNILREIRALGMRVRSGDHVCFFYAGHTFQHPNARGTEEDDMDEFLITHDGRSIIDNILYRYLIVPLPKDSFLVAILDSCHSGTLLDIEHTHCNASPGSNLELISFSATTNRIPLRRRTSEITVVSPSRQMSLDKENIPPTHSIDPAHWEPVPRCGSPLSVLSYPGCDGACRSRVREGISVVGHKQAIAANVLCISSCEDSQLTSYSEGTKVTMARCIIDVVASNQDVTVGELPDMVSRTRKQARADVWDNYLQSLRSPMANRVARITTRIQAKAPERRRTLPENMPTKDYFVCPATTRTDPPMSATVELPQKPKTVADSIQVLAERRTFSKGSIAARTASRRASMPLPYRQPRTETRCDDIGCKGTHLSAEGDRWFSEVVEMVELVFDALRPRHLPPPPADVVLSSKWPLNLQQYLRNWFSAPEHPEAVASPHSYH
ncbi:unnamed protein product [Mycena citricolor]|uniref:Peptidase C14 caspase domain-containing protein n=1 Tax=Mycena citricolor TaxID=2018698 RepID=A0AAD2HTH7_9AGAR|nr:unnamed protein product [Mycena citricolor]